MCFVFACSVFGLPFPLVLQRVDVVSKRMRDMLCRSEDPGPQSRMSLGSNPMAASS